MSDDKEKEIALSRLTDKLMQLPGFKEKLEAINYRFTLPIKAYAKPDFLDELARLADKIKESNEARTKHYPSMVQELDYLASKGWFFSVLLPLTELEAQIWHACGIPCNVEKRIS